MTTAETQTTTVSSEWQQEADSVARAAIDRQLERMVQQTADETTSLLLFDTDKPADPETKLPPLKAALKKQTSTNTQLAEKDTEKSEVQQHSQTTTTATFEGNGHWDGQQTTVQASSVSKWTDALLGTLGVVTGLVLTLIVIYIVRTIKR